MTEKLGNISKNEKDNKNIGRNIFKLRWGKYWSQAELVRRLQLTGLDMDRGTYSHIENGTRKLLAYEIPYFAKALEMSIEDFTKFIFSESE